MTPFTAAVHSAAPSQTRIAEKRREEEGCRSKGKHLRAENRDQEQGAHRGSRSPQHFSPSTVASSDRDCVL
jgi:hypothetical protein